MRAAQLSAFRAAELEEQLEEEREARAALQEELWRRESLEASLDEAKDAAFELLTENEKLEVSSPPLAPHPEVLLAPSRLERPSVGLLKRAWADGRPACGPVKTQMFDIYLQPKTVGINALIARSTRLKHVFESKKLDMAVNEHRYVGNKAISEQSASGCCKWTYDPMEPFQGQWRNRGDISDFDTSGLWQETISGG